MILNSETNTLYLSDILEKKQPGFFSEFTDALNVCGITARAIPGSKDIWARDFLPVQVSETKFVLFKYRPKYKNWLTYPKDEKTLTDARKVWSNLHIENCDEPIDRTDIVLEGGGISCGRDHAVITKKVLHDNRESFSEEKLISDLETELGVKIIVIPQYRGDVTGHADGMVRFIDDKTAVINETGYPGSPLPPWASLLRSNGIKCIPFPCDFRKKQKNYNASGIYINYLQIGDKFFIPVFGLNSKDETVKYIEELLPGKVIPVPVYGLKFWGGLINCVSWNIKT